MTIDVLSIGSAIVDVQTHTTDRFLDDQGMKKGSMALMTEEQSQTLYNLLDDPHACSGGSAGNTAVGIASLGGKSAYIGKVKNDTLGGVFTTDVRANGVIYTTPVSKEGPATASCIILVTPDAERTMNTYLGAATTIDVSDLEADKIAAAKITYLEGYVWDTPKGKDVLQAAANMAHQAGKQVAFTLSDPWFVDRHRDDLHSFVKEHVDILFANEQEITSLFKTTNFQDAANIIDAICPFAALTLGEEGSMICAAGQQHKIAAEPATKVEDTTGAGDLYAAGVLYGLSQGFSPEHCGRIGGICAAEVISHLGARPKEHLATLVDEKMAA